MDKNLRVQVLETYKRYLNAIVEADMETINNCVAYPLTYVGEDSETMLDKFPIDPKEWKKKTGWATSNDFEIDVVAVSERKVHILMHNGRRLRDDGSLIGEATGVYAFKNTKEGWKRYAFSDITFPA